MPRAVTPRGPGSPLPQPIKVIISICLLMEMAALVGAFAGFGVGVRNVLLILGGFWPDLLRGAPPTYGAQPVVMFGTSAVLHGGPLHLAMNMVALLWLGPVVIERAGSAAFWPIAGLSALGAGTVFTLMTSAGVPMIGASGAVFGLLGTVAMWEVLDRIARSESLVPLLHPAGMFLALNVALTLSVGSIAWEAHFGGFLAGALCGFLSWRRPRNA